MNTKIEQYLRIINKNIDNMEKDLVEFIINETIDRVQLYLNCETVPTKIERILASVVDNNLKRCLKNIEIAKKDITGVDQSITSISDNGQSISFSNEVTKYFTTTNDEEFFSGFTSLLARYRRIKVVYPKNNE